MIFYSLEGLRLVSSVAVVLHHYMDYLVYVKWIDDLRIAVDLFFVISGIVIANAYAGKISSVNDYIMFVRRRLARIYPLHLATLLFYVAIGSAVWFGLLHAPQSRYSLAALLPNILLVHAWWLEDGPFYNYVSWSISAEFLVYLLFPLVLGSARLLKPLAGLAAVAGLYLLSIAFSEVFDVGLTYLTWRAGAVRAIPSFAFGVWLSQNRTALAQLIPKSKAFALSTITLLVSVCCFAFGASQYLELFMAVMLVACYFVCDIHGVETLFSWRPLSRLGVLTYSIYMLHPVMATIVISFLGPKILGPSRYALISSVILSAALTLVLARLSYRRFETPLRDYFNQRRRRRGQPELQRRVPT